MYMATLGANSNIIFRSDGRFHRTTTTATARFQYSPTSSSSSTVAVFKVLSTTRKQPTRLHFLRHHRNSRGSVCQCQQHHKGRGESSPNPSNIPRVSK